MIDQQPMCGSCLILSPKWLLKKRPERPIRRLVSVSGNGLHVNGSLSHIKPSDDVPETANDGHF